MPLAQTSHLCLYDFSLYGTKAKVCWGVRCLKLGRNHTVVIFPGTKDSSHVTFQVEGSQSPTFVIGAITIYPGPNISISQSHKTSMLQHQHPLLD
jgi:hypothetical protein